jgi:hypothetical protein
MVCHGEDHGLGVSGDKDHEEWEALHGEASDAALGKSAMPSRSQERRPPESLDGLAEFLSKILTQARMQRLVSGRRLLRFSCGFLEKSDGALALQRFSWASILRSTSSASTV